MSVRTPTTTPVIRPVIVHPERQGKTMRLRAMAEAARAAGLTVEIVTAEATSTPTLGGVEAAKVIVDEIVQMLGGWE